MTVSLGERSEGMYALNQTNSAGEALTTLPSTTTVGTVPELVTESRGGESGEIDMVCSLFCDIV